MSDKLGDMKTLVDPLDRVDDRHMQPIDCAECDGSGEIVLNSSPVNDPQCEYAKPCEDCGGTGYHHCSICDEYRGQMHPPHNASPRCESGGRDHCSCDICF